MNNRHGQAPIAVFQDSEGHSRCINALHVQTFIPNPVGSGTGTLVTFASGDTVTLVDDFDAVYNTLRGDRSDG